MPSGQTPGPVHTPLVRSRRRRRARNSCGARGRQHSCRGSAHNQASSVASPSSRPAPAAGGAVPPTSAVPRTTEEPESACRAPRRNGTSTGTNPAGRALPWWAAAPTQKQPRGANRAALLRRTTHERHGGVSSRFRNRHGSERVLIPGTKRAATDPRLAGRVDLRLAHNSIGDDRRILPARGVALVAHDPAANDRIVQAYPGLSVPGEPVETVGIEPTSAIA